MGFWRKLLGREEEAANPFGEGTSSPALSPAPAAGASTPPPSSPFVSFASAPAEATWSTVLVNGKPVAPEQAQAFTAAFEQLGNLASMGSSQVVDLSGRPELREKVLAALREHSADPGALQAAVFEALGAAGLQTGTDAAMAGAPAAVSPDPVDQLRRLGELRDQGVLTEEEFAQQKRKLLDDI